MKASDLSDEDILNFTKFALELFEKRSENNNVAHSLMTSAAALSLVNYALDINSENATISLGEVNIAGKTVGDWRIIIQRGEAPLIDEKAPHVLAGRINPDKVKQAIDAFDSLTYMSVGIPSLDTLKS